MDNPCSIEAAGEALARQLMEPEPDLYIRRPLYLPPAPAAVEMAAELQRMREAFSLAAEEHLETAREVDRIVARAFKLRRRFLVAPDGTAWREGGRPGYQRRLSIMW